ncbi:CDGSH iron-sulfur domain-containing protein [Pseudomonadales bacterium]|jgi:CDGSH-type Zn-finger protein|nr:CDGSH iron-sulfur domain-containing protein [Gammaproteobacteria bacterium]MDA7773963.1 CDGSH iron-sulfur domain-containing protein [Pseudomonadales bacterium]MBT7537738.1 CDGSH iron-sulfur domain-containing protein [Gammaproteobacteria bacterium]MDB2450478.1 CDGSH iron-sulfur domain-containing protein [Pseudomonadales bacterium]MDB3988889.1 CDGSH iron-sulfur domain-containing protein [Pseudomonadales bacterium]|tara:strand:+ start:402 stop:638 length:237 start_codon:yes stop_codon:yes gene_type:complete
MSEPVRAADTPFGTEVEEGKSYFWCACGKSQKQPFCDGSHADTEFLPLKYTAEASKTLYFCGCKATRNAPLCDGSHNS